MFRKSPSKIFPYISKPLKRVYLDTETTGLDMPDAVILSIAFIVDKLNDEGNYEELSRLDLIIEPTEAEWDKASPEALKVNGMTREYLKENGVPLEEAQKTLYDFVIKNKLSTDTAYLIGQNPSFDIKFLSYYYPGLDWLNFPFREVVNNIELAAALMEYDYTFKPRKLSSHYLSRALGVEEETKLHTAMGGAEVVKRNYLALEGKFAGIFDIMRKLAAQGEEEAVGVPKFRLAKGDNLEEFSSWALENGYASYPGEPLWFSDKDGFRWEWLPGKPNILVNLNTTG